jgi:hypothetical protein
MTIKSQKGPPLTATLQPGDFPLGSPQSRAAVRIQLDRIRKAQSRENVVLHIPRPELDPMRYYFMDWAGNSKIGFRRLVIAPLKWVAPSDPVPVCPDCGKPFRKARELPDQVCYVGDCLGVHDPEREKVQCLI